MNIKNNIIYSKNLKKMDRNIFVSIFFRLNMSNRYYKTVGILGATLIINLTNYVIICNDGG